jgi:hypothetical protein
MVVYEFATSKKIRAVRRALDFWYKTLRDQMSVVDFLSCCEWSEENGQVKLVYNSDRLIVKLPEPK